VYADCLQNGEKIRTNAFSEKPWKRSFGGVKIFQRLLGGTDSVLISDESTLAKICRCG
jgi:hypothetical protein